MQLHSLRLNYSKLTKADAGDYSGMAMNAEVMRYITGKPLEPVEVKERFESMLIINDKIAEIGFYKVYEKNKNTFIGLGKLVFINGTTAEIGYSLLPAFWGKKYASEIANFFIDYAQELSFITDLLAVVNPENTASKKLLQNCGFTWLETGFVNDLPTEIHRLQFQHKNPY